MGREARQPSQQALLGWRAQLWIWFSQNTKPPAWSLSPRHWGLCQACAHPLRPCQGGGWAGYVDTVVPAGLSGRGPILLPKPSPASLAGTELLRLGGEPAPRKSSPAGRGAPHHGELLSNAVLMLRAWSEQTGAHWCPSQEASLEHLQQRWLWLMFIKHRLFAQHWDSATRYPVFAGSTIPHVPQFPHRCSPLPFCILLSPPSPISAQSFSFPPGNHFSLPPKGGPHD